MPHIILEYSSNLGDDDALAYLLDRLHDALGDTESFESERIKAAPYDVTRIMSVPIAVASCTPRSSSRPADRRL